MLFDRLEANQIGGGGWKFSLAETDTLVAFESSIPWGKHGILTFTTFVTGQQIRHCVFCDCIYLSTTLFPSQLFNKMTQCFNFFIILKLRTRNIGANAHVPWNVVLSICRWYQLCYLLLVLC